MKVKGFDKLQHYYLDRIWEKKENGEDLPEILQKYAVIVDPSEGSTEGPEYAQYMAEQLHSKLTARRAIDPANGQWRTWGFVYPIIGQPEEVLLDCDRHAETTQALAVAIDGTTGIVMCVEKRERVLPSSSLNDKVVERVMAFEEREGRPANKKDWAILKDEVTAAELVKAPIKRSRMFVLLWEMDCYVFTSSQKAAEETTGLIRSVLTSFPTVAVTNEDATQRFFRNVILRDESVKDTFTPGDYAVLTNIEKEKITIKDSDLEETRYKDLINEDNFMPVELLFLTLGGEDGQTRTWAKMNQKGDVKSFSLVDSDDGEDDGAELLSQRERGSAGYQSRVADIWLLMTGLRSWTQAMMSTGTMYNRKDMDDIPDGDDIAASATPTGGGAETVAPDDEDDDGAWDGADEPDDGDDEDDI